MRTTHCLAIGLALAWLVAGCSDEEATSSQPPGTGQPTGGKADCPNCDPAGPGAFEQAGLNTRWYQVGDKWHVAFQFKRHGSASRTDFILPDSTEQWTRGNVFLFAYEAVRAGKNVFDNVERDIIEVKVSQADPATAGLGQLGLAAERIDTHRYKVHFRMNDLTNALDVTYFSREYPNGRTVAAASNAALTTGTSLFPVNVPRLLVGGQNVVAPELPADLASIADAVVAGWRDRTYKRYDFANGDVVYWAEGYLWPFYVENDQGRGLLLDGHAPAE